MPTVSVCRSLADISVLCGLFLASAASVPRLWHAARPPPLVAPIQVAAISSVVSVVTNLFVYFSSPGPATTLVMVAAQRKKEAPARAHVKWPRGPVSPLSCALYPWCILPCPVQLWLRQLSTLGLARLASSLCLRLRHLRTGDINNCTTVRVDANKWQPPTVPRSTLSSPHAGRNKLLPPRAERRWKGVRIVWDLSIGAGHAHCGRRWCWCCWLTYRRKLLLM